MSSQTTLSGPERDERLELEVWSASPRHWGWGQRQGAAWKGSRIGSAWPRLRTEDRQWAGLVDRTDVQRRRHAKSGSETPFESCCVRGKYLDHISVTANEVSKNLGISCLRHFHEAGLCMGILAR